MEKPFINEEKNILKIICLILSYLSWLLVTINNFTSLKWMYNCKDTGGIGVVWNIGIYSNLKNSNLETIEHINRELGGEQDELYNPYYIPLQMYEIMIYIVFNFAYIITLIGCIVYIIKTLIKKDQEIINGMMGTISKIHFFPLLCAFVMALLGEIINGNNVKDIHYTGLIISILGLASMIFIYIYTNFKNNVWWTKFCLKEGTFSCLIILFWYNFCYVIYQCRYADKGHKDNDIQDLQKSYSLAFSIIFGIGSIAFSYVFRDIMISFMNILIYIGLIKYYFELGNTNSKAYNKNGEAAIDIIILIGSIILFLYLLIEYIQNEMIEIKSQIFNLGQIQTQTIIKVNENTEQINLITNNINLRIKGEENLEKNEIILNFNC